MVGIKHSVIRSSASTAEIENMEKYRLIQEQKPEEVVPTPTSNVVDHSAGRIQPSTTTQQHTSDTITKSTTSTSRSIEYPEVRITQQGKPRNYISYAMNLLVRHSIVGASSMLFGSGSQIFLQRTLLMLHACSSRVDLRTPSILIPCILFSSKNSPMDRPKRLF